MSRDGMFYAKWRARHTEADWARRNDLPCTYCGAGPGEPCTTATGTIRLNSPHVPRLTGLHNLIMTEQRNRVSQ